jgi:hypothetical protein
MFRLLKLCFSMAAFVAFAWFGTTVKLGQRTLFQHLRAIGQTQESRELIDGTREAAEPLFDGVRRRIAGQAPTPATAGPDGGAPEERLSPADKKQLRKFLADHR